METKKYVLQGKEFTSKKLNLKLRNDTFKLIKKFTDYSQDYIKESAIKLSEIEPDSLEYKYYQTQQNNDISLATISFLTDEDNLKELFTKVLDGDVESINYEAETDEAYWELITFGAEILNDFFTQFKLVKPQ